VHWCFGCYSNRKEQANGAAADGSFERYKSTDVGKRLSWPESRGLFTSVKCQLPLRG
jgi:hypothetical protein